MCIENFMFLQDGSTSGITKIAMEKTIAWQADLGCLEMLNGLVENQSSGCKIFSHLGLPE